MKKLRYKILAAISRKFADANICKAYFEKKVKHYEAKLNGKKGSLKESEVFKKFCEINSKYWDKIEHDNDAGLMLVEGLFAESGPNYVVRVGMIAKALEKVTKATPLVLLRLGEKSEPYKKQVWSSFKFDDFIGVYDDIYSNFSFFEKTKIKILTEIYFWWSKLLISLKKNNEFANISFDKVKIGDILYDEIIKETPVGQHTIKKISKKHKKFFEKMFVYFFVSKSIYEKYKPKYYVTTHIQYVSYGLPVRYFAHRGTLIIETTDDMLFIYDDFNTYPRFHTEVNRGIRKNFDKIFNDEKIQELAKKQLTERFTGQADQIDVQMAYKNKQSYSKELLKESLNIKNDNPIVFIFAHIFADTPQGASEKMLFADYYLWLTETIKFIRTVQDINWVIKPHPSSNVYGEEGDVAKLIKKFCKPSDSVFICPKDFNTASVLDCAKAIVTVQGTVGLEYSCMGIPIVLAGQAFFSGFGFTCEPQNQKEYFKQLKEINNLQPLSELQMKTAVTAYKAFSEMTNKDFSLIDTKMKDLVWGCSGKQDILGAFDLMSERLKNIDLKTRALYAEIEKRFK